MHNILVFLIILLVIILIINLTREREGLSLLSSVTSTMEKTLPRVQTSSGVNTSTADQDVGQISQDAVADIAPGAHTIPVQHNNFNSQQLQPYVTDAALLGRLA